MAYIFFAGALEIERPHRVTGACEQLAGALSDQSARSGDQYHAARAPTHLGMLRRRPNPGTVKLT